MKIFEIILAEFKQENDKRRDVSGTIWAHEYYIGGNHLELATKYCGLVSHFIIYFRAVVYEIEK